MLYKNQARLALQSPLLPTSVYKKQYACQRPKSALATSLMGISHPRFLPMPLFSRWQVRRSFLGADLAAGKAFEAAGLPPRATKVM